MKPYVDLLAALLTPVIAIVTTYIAIQQFFIGAHNETLSVVTMCVSNPDRSPARVHSCNAAPTPTGFAEIVSDDFPVFHFRSGEIRVLDATGNVERA
jgi:hypothetical protein